jgi:hypothetical protein
MDGVNSLTAVEHVAMFLFEKYAVEVVIADFKEKEGVEIGALTDKRILINKKSRDDVGVLFVIAHLFGHMVQFSNYEKYRHLVEEVEKPKPLSLSESFWLEFYEYECEAYRIGETLFLEALGPITADLLDERFQIYRDTDFVMFKKFLKTGRQISIDEFNEILDRNYIKWSGNYPTKLRTVTLPETVEPRKDATVY